MTQALQADVVSYTLAGFSSFMVTKGVLGGCSKFRFLGLMWDQRVWRYCRSFGRVKRVMWENKSVGETAGCLERWNG